MGLFNLKPSRSQALENARLIADLDALVAEPVSFRFGGQTHLIKPIDAETAAKFELARWHMMQEFKKPDLTHDEIMGLTTAPLSMVCPSITVEDVKKMNRIQIAALFKLIVEQIVGPDFQASEGEKKKS